MAKVDSKYILEGMVKRGYSPAAAAGIAGNAAQESGFRTDVIGDGGAAMGLWQWNGPRKQKLLQFAQSRGMDATNPDLQMDFLHHELSTGYRSTQKAINSINNPKHAALIFSKQFERPNPKYANNEHRMGAAASFFKIINPISMAQADETPWQPEQDIDVDGFRKWKAAKTQPQPQPEQDIDVEGFKAWKAKKDSKPLDPTEGMSTTDKVLAGVGGAMMDTAYGAGQMVGLVSPEDVAEKRRLDKPLLNTTAGTVGNVAGNVATFLPAVAIPGANTIKGASLIGAGIGALQPAESVGEVVANTGVGAAANAAGVGIGQAVSKLGKAKPLSATQQAAKEAIDAGYSIPPSQVNPTVKNRLAEGFAGKLTTAQNASAKNQEITNSLIKKAINADELSTEGLAAVRKAANAQYDELGKVGKFQSDDAFKTALDKASANTEAMLKDFPELQNQEITKLVDGLKGRGEFDSQTAIEAIKRLRSHSQTNKSALDPGKKELGRAQSKIASALEDLIDRNLQKTGNTELLKNYQNARQTLAKTHEVEKALNPSTGNVDARKFGASIKKGKPLTGELKQVGDFANKFEKAAQMPEKMGSLPQSSPLDWAVSGGASAVSGNPALLAGVLARPAMRKLILSRAVQKGLIKEGSDKITPKIFEKLIKLGAVPASISALKAAE